MNKIKRHSVIYYSTEHFIKGVLIGYHNWYGHIEYKTRVLDTDMPNIKIGQTVYLSPERVYQ